MPSNPYAAKYELEATAVAQLIGFDLVRSFADLPAGFRLRWMEAEENGAFKDCLTVGDLKRAYCQHICPELDAGRL